MIHATFNDTCTVQEMIDTLMKITDKSQRMLMMLEINDEETEVAGIHVVQDLKNPQTQEAVIGLITKDFSGLQLPD